jgi:nucleotide-binding universal stress UspA family protein
MLADLGGPLDADIIVLHVRECLLGAGGEWILGTNGPFDEGRETAAHILERVVSPLRSRGIRARGVAVAGRPGQVARIVVDAAVAEHAGLIVVGFHPRSLVGELVAGGKARKIQRLSPVPVLTLRTRRRETRTV